MDKAQADAFNIFAAAQDQIEYLKYRKILRIVSIFGLIAGVILLNFFHYKTGVLVTTFAILFFTHNEGSLWFLAKKFVFPSTGQVANGTVRISGNNVEIITQYNDLIMIDTKNGKKAFVLPVGVLSGKLFDNIQNNQSPTKTDAINIFMKWQNRFGYFKYRKKIRILSMVGFIFGTALWYFYNTNAGAMITAVAVFYWFYNEASIWYISRSFINPAIGQAEEGTIKISCKNLQVIVKDDDPRIILVENGTRAFIVGIWILAGIIKDSSDN